jgi:hypothetical protein
MTPTFRRALATTGSTTWKPLVAALIVVLALILFPTPARALSDNTNLIQQILAILQSIQTILVGTHGSVASLQSDVSAVKTRTDNLPADTEAALTDIKNSVGAGPLTKMFATSFTVELGEEKLVNCSSSGPFLLHIHGSGRDGVISVTDSATFGYEEHVISGQTAHIVAGGNGGDAVSVHTSAAEVFNPNNFIRVLITMQTTQDAIIGTCYES